MNSSYSVAGRNSPQVQRIPLTPWCVRTSAAVGSSRARARLGSRRDRGRLASRRTSCGRRPGAEGANPLHGLISIRRARQRLDPPQHEDRAGQAGDDRRRRAGHERAGAPGHAQMHAESNSSAQDEDRGDDESAPGVGPGQPVQPVKGGAPPDDSGAPPRVAACQGIAPQAPVEQAPPGGTDPIAPALRSAACGRVKSFGVVFFRSGGDGGG